MIALLDGRLEEPPSREYLRRLPMQDFLRLFLDLDGRSSSTDFFGAPAVNERGGVRTNKFLHATGQTFPHGAKEAVLECFKRHPGGKYAPSVKFRSTQTHGTGTL